MVLAAIVGWIESGIYPQILQIEAMRERS